MMKSHIFGGYYIKVCKREEIEKIKYIAIHDFIALSNSA